MEVHEDYYPSEVARLVLGYLNDSGSDLSFQLFLAESCDLKEHYHHFVEQNKWRSLTVDGKSLLQILSDYCRLTKRNVAEGLESACGRSRNLSMAADSKKTFRHIHVQTEQVEGFLDDNCAADDVDVSSIASADSYKSVSDAVNESSTCRHLDYTRKQYADFMQEHNLSFDILIQGWNLICKLMMPNWEALTTENLLKLQLKLKAILEDECEEELEDMNPEAISEESENDDFSTKEDPSEIHSVPDLLNACETNPTISEDLANLSTINEVEKFCQKSASSENIPDICKITDGNDHQEKSVIQIGNVKEVCNQFSSPTLPLNLSSSALVNSVSGPMMAFQSNFRLCSPFLKSDRFLNLQEIELPRSCLRYISLGSLLNVLNTRSAQLTSEKVENVMIEASSVTMKTDEISNKNSISIPVAKCDKMELLPCDKKQPRRLQVEEIFRLKRYVDDNFNAASVYEQSPHHSYVLTRNSVDYIWSENFDSTSNPNYRRSPRLRFRDEESKKLLERPSISTSDEVGLKTTMIKSGSACNAETRSGDFSKGFSSSQESGLNIVGSDYSVHQMAYEVPVPDIHGIHGLSGSGLVTNSSNLKSKYFNDVMEKNCSQDAQQNIKVSERSLICCKRKSTSETAPSTKKIASENFVMKSNSDCSSDGTKKSDLKQSTENKQALLKALNLSSKAIQSSFSAPRSPISQTIEEVIKTYSVIRTIDSKFKPVISQEKKKNPEKKAIRDLNSHLIKETQPNKINPGIEVLEKTSCDHVALVDKIKNVSVVIERLHPDELAKAIYPYKSTIPQSTTDLSLDNLKTKVHEENNSNMCVKEDSAEGKMCISETVVDEIKAYSVDTTIDNTFTLVNSPVKKNIPEKDAIQQLNSLITKETQPSKIEEPNTMMEVPAKVTSDHDSLVDKIKNVSVVIERLHPDELARAMNLPMKEVAIRSPKRRFSTSEESETALKSIIPQSTCAALFDDNLKTQVLGVLEPHEESNSNIGCKKDSVECKIGIKNLKRNSCKKKTKIQHLRYKTHKFWSCKSSFLRKNSKIQSITALWAKNRLNQIKKKSLILHGTKLKNNNYKTLSSGENETRKVHEQGGQNAVTPSKCHNSKLEANPQCSQNVPAISKCYSSLHDASPLSASSPKKPKLQNVNRSTPPLKSNETSISQYSSENTLVNDEKHQVVTKTDQGFTDSVSDHQHVQKNETVQGLLEHHAVHNHVAPILTSGLVNSNRNTDQPKMSLASKLLDVSSPNKPKKKKHISVSTPPSYHRDKAVQLKKSPRLKKHDTSEYKSLRPCGLSEPISYCKVSSEDHKSKLGVTRQLENPQSDNVCLADTPTKDLVSVDNANPNKLNKMSSSPKKFKKPASSTLSRLGYPPHLRQYINCPMGRQSCGSPASLPHCINDEIPIPLGRSRNLKNHVPYKGPIYEFGPPPTKTSRSQNQVERGEPAMKKPKEGCKASISKSEMNIGMESSRISEKEMNIGNESSCTSEKKMNIGNKSSCTSEKEMNIENESSPISEKQMNIGNESSHISEKEMNIGNESSLTSEKKMKIANEGSCISEKELSFGNEESASATLSSDCVKENLSGNADEEDIKTLKLLIDIVWENSTVKDKDERIKAILYQSQLKGYVSGLIMELKKDVKKIEEKKKREKELLHSTF